MERMTYQQAKQYLIDFNKKYNIRSKVNNKINCSIVVVIDPKSFKNEYTLESRSYVINNEEKAFLPDMLGYSIFSHSLDNTDPCVRLERYLREEGNEDGWIVDYCYILEENRG